MSTLSFDLLRLVMSHLVYEDVINLLCVNKKLAQELINDSFWRNYFQLRAPTLVPLIKKIKQRHTSWKKMCSSDIFCQRTTHRIKGKRNILDWAVPITYHEDMIARLISGAVFVYVPGEKQRVQLFCNPDKIIFSRVVDNHIIRVLYLFRGRLHWYASLVMDPNCYSDHIIAHDAISAQTKTATCLTNLILASEGNITNVAFKSFDGLNHVIQVRERTKLVYVTFRQAKPCEASKKIHIIEEKELDICVPASVTSIAIVVNSSGVFIFLVTSHRWLYRYCYNHEEVWLIHKEPDIIKVTNYKCFVMALDVRGCVKQLLYGASSALQWTCDYVQHKDEIYLRRKKSLCTFRNFISDKCKQSYQSVQPTTLIESEERIQEMK